MNIYNIKANRRLNLISGIAVSLIYVTGFYFIDWGKVHDPIANGLYFYILIPFSLFLSVTAILFSFSKSFKPLFKYGRVVINIIITGYLFFFLFVLFIDDLF